LRSLSLFDLIHFTSLGSLVVYSLKLDFQVP
jgi:hypothetical protein